MLLLLNSCAGVAKLVDAPDLGSGALGRVGSSPITRTIFMILFELTLIYRYLMMFMQLGVKQNEK